VLISIPRGRIYSSRLTGELILGKANSSIIAVIGADCSLTSYSFIVSEASTLSGRSITCAFIGAFYGGMSVVGIYYRSNPSFIPEVIIYFKKRNERHFF